MSSACSMASTSTSKEISFSRSSERSTIMSMSIGSALLPVELDLDPGFGHLVVGHDALGAVDVERRSVLVAAENPPRDRLAVLGGDLHQTRLVASPVPRKCERPVGAG